MKGFMYVFGLFGVVGAKNFFDEDFLQIQKNVQRGIDTFEAGRLVHHRHESSLFNRLTAQMGLTHKVAVEEAPVTPENNGTCCSCVNATVHHIMGAVVEHVKKECAETKCPVIQKHCEHWEKHPKVAFGYLLAAVRPFGLGYAYCFGKGSCNHTVVMSMDREPAVGMEKEFDNEDVGKLFDDSLAQTGHMHKTMLEIQQNDFENDVIVDKHHKKNHCRRCIWGGAIRLMRRTVHRVKEFCEKTKDAKAMRRCAMAKAHPQVALGVLIHRVRPAEWSCGLCIGNKKCRKHNDMENYSLVHNEIAEEKLIF